MELLCRLFFIISFTIVHDQCSIIPPYVNTGTILQKILTDCTTTAVTGDSNYIYAGCANIVYIFARNQTTGLVHGTSINDYNGTAMRLPSGTSLTSLYATDKTMYMFDIAFGNMMACPTNELKSCTSGVQVTGNNVGSAFVDQYNYVWANGMMYTGSECCTSYYYNNVVTVYDTSNDLITMFNLTKYSIARNIPPNTRSVLVTALDDKLYVANGLNLTSYTIKRNAGHQPIALQLITSYTELTNPSNFYISMSYNSLGQVVALSNAGDVLIIGQDGGPFYFPLPENLNQTTGIWMDSKTGHAFVTSNNWLYVIDISSSFRLSLMQSKEMIYGTRAK